METNDRMWRLYNSPEAKAGWNREIFRNTMVFCASTIAVAAVVIAVVYAAPYFA